MIHNTPPLPMTRTEMKTRGWDELDVLFVTGDAYVDHPSFGVALLGRWLEHHGFRVGIVAQPRWDTTDDITCMGQPRLFCGVTAGALDSMLAHYTAFRKLRRDDAYTPGNLHGKRPNRACVVYTGLVRRAFPGLPVVLGGIEASLRRATHYDFWTEKLRRSILLDSKADLVVYGMGERAILKIAQRLDGGAGVFGMPGTVFAPSKKQPWDFSEEAEVRELPSHEAIEQDGFNLMKLTDAFEQQVHQGSWWATQTAGGRKIVFAPPQENLSSEELDALYALPYTRKAHPSYTKRIPAADMIQFSVTTHRGCGGGCSFCSLALHQGRHIRSRSAASIEAEVRTMAQHDDWRGSISDVGGPSANMWGAKCTVKNCKRNSCMTPKICPQFKADQGALTGLLKKLQTLPGVKHVRVASGVRHDLAMREPDYVRALIQHFVGGQLKLAPEHMCEQVLTLMRKPSFEVFKEFMTVFEKRSREGGKEQYIIPYLISAFPGCTEEDMRELNYWIRKKGWKPQQVQCFIPTPGTIATAMYYCGKDPQGQPIPVPKSDKERLRQHKILMPKTGERDRAPQKSPWPGKNPIQGKRFGGQGQRRSPKTRIKK